MQNPKKRPAQTLNRAKTTVVCNLFEFVVRFLQSAPGCFNAQALHEPCRGCTSVLQEHARNFARVFLKDTGTTPARFVECLLQRAGTPRTVPGLYQCPSGTRAQSYADSYRPLRQAFLPVGPGADCRGSKNESLRFVSGRRPAETTQY